MSVGSALVLIALGVLFYLRPTVFFITMKVCGVLVVVGALGFGAWYGYGKYKDYKETHKFDLSTVKRVYVKQTQLSGISIGMKKPEVTVAMASKPEFDDDNGALGWGAHQGKPITFVRINDKSKTVSIICLEKGDQPSIDDSAQGNIFGLRIGSQEQQMITQLGTPPKVSINEDAIRKMASYPDLQIAFEISGQAITSVCVTDHAITYTKEYDEKAEAQAKLEKKQAEEKAAAEKAKRAEGQAELEASNARAQKLREAQEAQAREGIDQRLRAGSATPADLEEVKKMAARFCAKKNDDRYTATNGYFYNQCVESRIRDIQAGNL